MLADSDWVAWLRQAWPSLQWLLMAAGAAFLIGGILRLRQARIQRRYQRKMEQGGQGDEEA